MGNVEARRTPTASGIEFDAEHVQGDIHFAWHGRGACRNCHGGDGPVRDGRGGAVGLSDEPHRDLRAAPGAGMRRAACTVEHPDGSRETSRFPVEIAPHQPFMNVRAMAYRAGGTVAVDVGFDGEVFETEDQPQLDRRLVQDLLPSAGTAISLRPGAGADGQTIRDGHGGD